MENKLPSFVRVEDGQYILSKNDIVYSVNANIGGRISSLQFNGAETLLVQKSTDDNLNEWGNVFWPSPQSDWGWPPAPELDHLHYSVTANNDFLILTSAADPASGLAFEKHYGFSDSKNRVLIRYRIYNHTKATKKVAPWEITRFPPSGRTFFPTGTGQSIQGDFDPLPTVAENGITWFNYNHSTIGPRDHKLMIDGQGGWLAYFNNNILFVKHFNDITPDQAAPGEGEIEIYAKGAGTYIEVEQQGEYTNILPGEFLEWLVEWSVIKVECTQEPTKNNNQALLEAIKAL